MSIIIKWSWRTLLGIFNLFNTLIRTKEQFLLPWFKKRWPKTTLLKANALSFYRILVALWIIYLLLNFPQTKKQICFWLVFGISLDFIDGLVARAQNNTNNLGAFLDRLADKMLLVPLIAFFLWPLSKWLVVIFLGIEIMSSIISVLGIAMGIDIASNIVGKYKMILEVVVALLILIIPFATWQESYFLFSLVGGVVALAVASFLLHLYSEYLKKGTKEQR